MIDETEECPSCSLLSSQSGKSLMKEFLQHRHSMQYVLVFVHQEKQGRMTRKNMGKTHDLGRKTVTNQYKNPNFNFVEQC